MAHIGHRWIWNTMSPLYKFVVRHQVITLKVPPLRNTWTLITKQWGNTYSAYFIFKPLATMAIHNVEKASEDIT